MVSNNEHTMKEKWYLKKGKGLTRQRKRRDKCCELGSRQRLEGSGGMLLQKILNLEELKCNL